MGAAARPAAQWDGPIAGPQPCHPLAGPPPGRATPSPASNGLRSWLGLREVPAGLCGSWHLTPGLQAKRSFGVMSCPLGLTMEFCHLLLFQ